MSFLLRVHNRTPAGNDPPTHFGLPVRCISTLSSPKKLEKRPTNRVSSDILAVMGLKRMRDPFSLILRREVRAS